MQQTLQTLIQICLLKAKTEDLPVSINSLYLAAFAMFFGLMITDSIRTPDTNVLATSLVNVGLLMLVLRILVILFKKPERWLQFTTAIMGCNALIMLAIAPFIAMALNDNTQNLMSFARLVILAAMIWSVVIRVRIMKDTLEITPGLAVVVALVMEMAVYVILFQLFGNQIL